MTTTTASMADKGDDYVARWPAGIARRLGATVEMVAHAMVVFEIISEARAAELLAPMTRGEHIAEVAAMTPDQAKRVVRHIQVLALPACDECGVRIPKGTGMTANLGLACGPDCYDAMSERPGRHASHRR